MIPLNNTCLVRPDLHQEAQSSGGIWLTKMAYRGLPDRGVVHAMPKGVFDFGVGDRVFYDKTRSNVDAISHEGRPLAVVPIDAVLAIIP